jgi:site-specific recombinase XerD
MPTKEKDGTYRTRRRTPGYGSGSLVMRLGTKDSKTAVKREGLLIACYDAGAHDLLDALRSKELAWTVAMKHKDDGLGVIRGALEAQRAAKATVAHDAERLLEEYRTAMRGDIGDKQIQKNAGAVRRFIARLRETHKLKPDEPVPITLFNRASLKAHRDGLVDEEFRKAEKALCTEWASADNPPPKPEQDRLLEEVHGSKRATANRHTNGVGAFCVWFMEAYPGVLTESPAEKVRWSMGEENPQRERTYRYLTPPQLKTLFAYAKKYDEANPAPKGVAVPDLLYWRYITATGASPYTEATWLKVDHIDFSQESDGLVLFYVHGTKSQYRPRHVPGLRDLAEDILARARKLKLGKNRRIFPFSHAQYLDVWHGVMDLIRAEKPDGWEQVVEAVPYDLRHSFAVGAVRNGVDLTQLMTYMGHNDISTTLIYARHGEGATKALAAFAAQLR